MLKWNRYKNFVVLRTYGFYLDPTRKYYYKKLNDDSEISVYCLSDDLFNMYDVIIESTSGTIIYELDILYELIKEGYVIKC